MNTFWIYHSTPKKTIKQMYKYVYMKLLSTALFKGVKTWE